MNELIQAILNLMPKSSLSESFIEAVLKRLAVFGYHAEGQNDEFALCFAIQKVEEHVKNSCNTATIPDGLVPVAVDRVCGEFFYAKKQTGQLQIADLDFSGVVTSISEGDTSISFGAGASDDERFNQMLNYLTTQGESDFVCYRKLKW